MRYWCSFGVQIFSLQDSKFFLQNFTQNSDTMASSFAAECRQQKAVRTSRRCCYSVLVCWTATAKNTRLAGGVTLLGSDVTTTCAGSVRTHVEARVRAGRVNATKAGRIAAWRAVVRVLPVAGVSDERPLRHGQQFGGQSTWSWIVLHHWRQAARLLRSRPMFGVLVPVRVAAAGHCGLARLTTSVVVRVDGVVVEACQLAAVMRQQLWIGVMLVAIGLR